MGLWLSLSGNTFALLISELDFSTVGAVVIAIGAAVIVVACIGIVGAVGETNFNKVMLAIVSELVLLKETCCASQLCYLHKEHVCVCVCVCV